MKNNPHFDAFREQLEHAGVTMRLDWESRSDGNAVGLKAPADVFGYSFIGSGFQPAILNGVFVDYGKDSHGRARGYGFFPASETANIGFDVFKIASTKEHPLPPIRA